MLHWSSSHDCACPQIYPYLVLNDVTTINECRREERVLQLCRLLNYCLKKDKVQIACVYHFCMRAHACSCGLLHYSWYDNGVVWSWSWCYDMKSTLASHSCFPKLNFHVFGCILCTNCWSVQSILKGTQAVSYECTVIIWCFNTTRISEFTCNILWDNAVWPSVKTHAELQHDEVWHSMALRLQPATATQTFCAASS